MLSSFRSIALFTFAYLAVAAWFAVSLKNWEFILYITVVLLLGLIVTLIHRRVRLSTGILWCLSIWGLLHMIGGLVPTPESWPVNGDKHVFYSLWLIPNLLKYDHVIHAYGFGVSTWICWQALSHTFPGVRPTAGVLSLCALAAMGLGATNEIVEFTAVLLIPDTNVGGYVNTGWDLVANMVGAVIAAVIIRFVPVRTA